MKKSLILFLFLPFFLVAQKKITGTVVDSNSNFLLGVKVTVEGSNNQILTEADGAFTLITKGAGNLIFSKVGFSD
jgi:hypothetical protein